MTEEKLFENYYLDPFKVVGLEGMWGSLYYIILLPIMQNIHCSIEDICGNGRLEDSLLAIKQMGKEPILIAQSFGIICSIACFNCFGAATTKYASAPQRSTVDTSRTVIIWAFFVLIDHEVFHW